MYEAKIIKDSICNDYRLTTMQLTHPRIVHAEFNTHCMFARNASSSRAIPFKKMLERVSEDPFVPVWWGKNQKGMQAAEELNSHEQYRAKKLWLEARDNAIKVAKEMAMDECTRCEGSGKYESPWYHGDMCHDCNGTGYGINLHKQIVNRLLEPFSWITVCVTGDAGAWSNYFALRCHKDAQPEIRKQAEMAATVYWANMPTKLNQGQWHLPYVSDDEIAGNAGRFDDRDMSLVRISTGRCARTSYLTQEGKHDPQADIALHDRLYFSVPMHASPFEHVCQATGDDIRYGKYVGWKAYRHMIQNEYVTDWRPNEDTAQ